MIKKKKRKYTKHTGTIKLGVIGLSAEGITFPRKTNPTFDELTLNIEGGRKKESIC